MNIIVKDSKTREEYKFIIETIRSVIELKKLVAQKLCTELSDLTFVYKGIYIDDEKTISTYNLGENDIIVMVRKFNPVSLTSLKKKIQISQALQI